MGGSGFSDSWRKLGAIPPGEPVPDGGSAETFDVCFLDRVGASTLAPRYERTDCLPETWERPQYVANGLRVRRWKLEQGKTGPVYREIAPRFVNSRRAAELEGAALETALDNMPVHEP